MFVVVAVVVAAVVLPLLICNDSVGGIVGVFLSVLHVIAQFWVFWGVVAVAAVAVAVAVAAVAVAVAVIPTRY